MVELTKEQQEFLLECEEEFKDRFTEKDEEFMKVKLREPQKPPILDLWNDRQRNRTGHRNIQSSRQTYSRPNRKRTKRKRDRTSDRVRGDRDRDRSRNRRDISRSRRDGRNRDRDRNRGRRDRGERREDRERLGEPEKPPTVDPLYSTKQSDGNDSSHKNLGLDKNDDDKDSVREKEVRDRDGSGESEKPPIVDPLLNTQQSDGNDSSHQNHGLDKNDGDKDCAKEKEARKKNGLEEPEKPPIVDPLHNTQQSDGNDSPHQNHGLDKNDDDRDSVGEKEARDTDGSGELEKPPITQHSDGNDFSDQNLGLDKNDGDKDCVKEKEAKKENGLEEPEKPAIVDPLHNTQQSDGNDSPHQNLGLDKSDDDKVSAESLIEKRDGDRLKEPEKPPIVDPSHNAQQSYPLYDAQSYSFHNTQQNYPFYNPQQNYPLYNAQQSYPFYNAQQRYPMYNAQYYSSTNYSWHQNRGRDRRDRGRYNNREREDRDRNRERRDRDRSRGDRDRSRGDRDRSRGDRDRSRGDRDRSRGDRDRRRDDRDRGSRHGGRYHHRNYRPY